jgi:chromosome partitioning protein
MTIFDLPEQTAAADLQQWEPILNWLKPLLYPLQAANDAMPENPATAPGDVHIVRPVSALHPKPTAAAPSPGPSRLGSSLPNSLLPAQESMVHGARLSVLGSGRPGSTPVIASGKPAMARNGNSAGGLQIPQFLKRVPN